MASHYYLQKYQAYVLLGALVDAIVYKQQPIKQDLSHMNLFLFYIICLQSENLIIESGQSMELKYQQYVKRLNYDPYQWPPDISLAELHSRVSQQGPVSPNGVKCPCCNFQSKTQFKGWFMKDIAEDCRGYGTAIPAFFGLLMYYIIAIFVVICLNTIYQMWAVYYTCQNYLTFGETSCIKFGPFYYIDMKIQLNILQSVGETSISTTLIVLETITFYILMLVNLSSLFYLYRMQKQENKQTENKKFVHHALIIGNLKELQFDKIAQKLDVSSKLQIIDVIPLVQFKRYYELFHKRNILYYKLMSKYVGSQDPRPHKKLNNSLIQLHAEVLVEKQMVRTQKFNNLLIIFKNSFSRTLVMNKYSLDQLKKIHFGFKQIFTDFGLSKQKWELPIYVLKVPDANEIKWENAGQNIKSKLSGRLKTFLIAILLVIISLCIFYVPITWQLSTEASNPAKLTTWQKVIPLMISIVLFIMATLYTNYMRSVANRRYPLSEFQASKFVLMTTMLFHILFYILIPVIFFAIPNYIGDTAKLFVIAQQAHTFVILQVILNLIDIPYQMWKSKKLKNLSDQREGFKYNQLQLHKQVEFRDFPLQFRIQSTFKIWSFILFYVFYIPYMMIYMFAALVILYILEKYNFYHHYALRRAISLQLQKSFLIYFVNFFGLFQCLSYCLNATESWMIISSVTITLILLVSNIVFWNCIMPHYSKSKQFEKGMQQLLIESEKQDDPSLIQNLQKSANEFRASYQIFKELNINDNLDDQIDQYIRSLSNQDTETARSSIDEQRLKQKKQVQRYIQLSNSQVQNNLD